MGSHEDEIIRHLMDLKESVGGLNAKCEAANTHLASVSKKADGIREDLEAHREDINAHGKAAVNANIAAWGSGIAFVVALYGAAKAWFNNGGK